MTREEFTKDLEHWTRQEIIDRAYDICCENIELEKENERLKEQKEKQREKWRIYQRRYRANKPSVPKNKVEYAIYDLNDNYVYGGTFEEILKYTGKNKSNLYSTISGIKSKRIKYTRIDKMKCLIYRIDNE